MTVLMTSASVAFFELLPDAEAVKSQGKNAPGRIAVNSYGSANSNIVCGDRLCSEVKSSDAGNVSSEKHDEKRNAMMMEKEKTHDNGEDD